MNLSRVSKALKTGFKWAPALILENLIQIYVEQTKFEPRLKFKPWLKFFKFGLRWNYEAMDEENVYATMYRDTHKRWDCKDD